MDECISSMKCKLAYDRVRTRNDPYCNLSTLNTMVIVEFYDVEIRRKNFHITVNILVFVTSNGSYF